MKVLLADDDRIAIAMLENQLQSLGYEVLTANDGQEAWDLFQREAFSIVISDWLMPRVDGIELVRRIRGLDAAQYVYCILLTVKSQQDDVVSGMEAGADDFLTKPFDPNELRVRLAAGKRIVALERQLRASNSRMRKELQAAASIQQAILPNRLPETLARQFAWKYQPSDELGGDILNVVPLGPDHVAIYLLDVAGHGVSAALLSVALSRLLSTTANTSSLIREQEAGEYRIVEPSEVLLRLNNQFCHLPHSRMFTMIYGVLNLQTRQFRYASGGHCPALLISRDGGVRKLASTGTVVGILEDMAYQQEEVHLQPQDRLLVYSDGITEARNRDDVEFGLDRLIELTSGQPERSLNDTLDLVVRELEEWSPGGFSDDVSCLFTEVV